MEMQPVESSNIHSIGYDPATRTMRIAFRDRKNGATRLYEYQGVSPVEHAALIKADSVGGHFHAHVRHRYIGTRVE